MTASNLSEAASRFCADRGLALGEVLGQGAFKTVYRVESASKSLALKLAEAGPHAERLQRESQALNSCKHPAIASIEEAMLLQFDDQDVWVVLEEYLAGGTLEGRLHQVMPDHVKRIGITLAEVLGHLEERRLVHRDIKPANILFRSSGWDPVLTDFGVVRMLEASTLTAQFAWRGPGTPAYAAPEQLNNDKELINWRTDQFGLAVVLAWCLLKRHPFLSSGETYVETAVDRVTAREPMPEANAKFLTQAGFSSLVKALSPWPANRFRRPHQFIAALRGEKEAS